MKTRVLQIQGFGPVTVRGLSKREYLKIQREAGGDLDVQVALAIQQGVVQPKFTELAGLEGKDEEIDSIANAIIDLTRPNVL